MEGLASLCFSSSSSAPLLASPLQRNSFLFSSSKQKSSASLRNPVRAFRFAEISCKLPESESETERNRSVSISESRSKMEEYNIAMKNMMRNPYEYHHDLGMNYTLITEDLIVGSQPQKAEDIDHLKTELNVGYILNLQQDKDVEYWGIDLKSIVMRCGELGIHHMRRPARDFDPDSLRSGLPKAVSSLEWAVSEGNGRVYVHCTAGLGRAPAVAIAYMFWFRDMNLNTAYNALTSKRPCGPNKRAIRGATYDLAKNEPWKEPFERLPEHAFEDVADWERKLIQDRVRALR
ncbi:Phosphoglucan phosphatase LSF2, chloroplastic [Sesamum alatum]|uniref:Phosphoglucan phosphatase LSF2, chloroplastic n=1 Tax=Sesamum alatum TaxID=300844 RepID=A0AAE1YPG7_9LAMI|nr:Phosphoglucan phosphatase LSF2, chloroplastic [Sesamum alatum]